MAYGNGYEQVEFNSAVTDGDYEVRLGMPVDKEVSGYRLREIPIQIRGQPNAKPDRWTWFDMPTSGDNLTERQMKWNQQRTKDADCFGVARGDFRPQSWAGKVGWVHIAKNTKTGYMEVRWSVMKDEAAPKPQERKPVQQKEVFDSEPESFPDDIPF